MYQRRVSTSQRHMKTAHTYTCMVQHALEHAVPYMFITADHDMQMMLILVPHAVTYHAKVEDHSILRHMKRTETILGLCSLGTH